MSSTPAGVGHPTPAPAEPTHSEQFEVLLRILAAVEKLTDRVEAIEQTLSASREATTNDTAIVKAIIERPSRVATRTGIFAATLSAIAPKAYEVVMNTAFTLFPDSAAAKGMKGRDEAPSNEQIAFASLMRGVHW